MDSRPALGIEHAHMRDTGIPQQNDGGCSSSRDLRSAFTVHGHLKRMPRNTLVQQTPVGFVITACMACASAAFAQSSLPDDVQADVLRAKIVKMAKVDGKGHQDFAGILSSIDEYKKLDVDVPPVILLVEAKAAHANSDSVRAINALESYMMVADRKSQEYQQAVELYPEYQTAAEPKRQLQRDKITAQPLDCKDPAGQQKQDNYNAHFYIFPLAIKLVSALAGAHSSLTISYKIMDLPHSPARSTEFANARVSLIAQIPFARDQMIPFATIAAGVDKRTLQPEERVDLTSVAKTHNPPAGKYCVVVEGFDGTQPDFSYEVLPDPLVILP
jgi:hypothetical protein